MRFTVSVGSVFLIAALAAGLNVRAAAPPVADPPAAAPNTLWSFLGIPQGINKIKDATSNKNGNRPCKERKPPLKRIADPANLESQNPAIKAAAKIKAEEDLAPQKIKAIKYLATVGCGCYPGVRDALVAALDDCTEEVRYQAAIALYQAAGNPCKNCEKSGCCNAAVMSKLEDVAHGQDEKGCFKEMSPRVRAAAENALNACQRKIPAGAVPTEAAPPKKELPTQGVPEAPEPPSSIETPVPTPAAPRPAPVPQGKSAYRPGRSQASDDGASKAGQKNWADVNPVSSIGFAEVEDQEAAPTANAVAMGRFGPRRCPPEYYDATSTTAPCPQPLGEGKAAPGEAAPGGPGAPGAAGEQAAPYSNALAGNFGAASGASSVAPNMIGDFCSSGGNVILRGVNSLEQVVVLSQGNVAIAGGDRVFKIAEDDSPIPTDRVFFDYNHYQNPLVDAQGNARNLERFTFGVEKTFFNGQCSVEMRLPFANGLNTTQSLAPDAGLMGTEFEDIPLVFKAILRKWDHAVLAAGFAVSLPTAKDTSLFDQVGVEQIRVRNDAIHVGPIVGLLWTPNDCWFVEGFAQADFDTRGNDVYMNTGDALVKAGTVQDPSLLFLDIAVGRWIYKNPCAQWITGVAPTVELHYTTTMQNADVVNGTTVIGPDNTPTQTVGCLDNRWDVLDLTAGLHFIMGPRTTFTVAAVVPLRTGDDRDFDAEVLGQLDRRF